MRVKETAEQGAQARENVQVKHTGMREMVFRELDYAAR